MIFFVGRPRVHYGALVTEIVLVVIRRAMKRPARSRAQVSRTVKWNDSAGLRALWFKSTSGRLPTFCYGLRHLQCVSVPRRSPAWAWEVVANVRRKPAES